MADDTDKKKIPNLVQSLRRKRPGVILVGLVFLVGCFIVLLGGQDCIDEQQMLVNIQDTSMNDAVHLLSQQQPSENVLFQNLNEPVANQDQVVVMAVLPPSSIGTSLDTFFSNLARQSHRMTRLALLVLNPASPASVHAVRNAVKASQLPFSVQLYTKSFDDSIARWVQQDDHQQGKVYELEPFHKSAMARARNYLLQTALDPMDQYVIWLDPMLEDFPPTLIEDMQRIMDKGTTHDDKPATIDVLAPNTMIIKDGTEWGYERGNWQETELSKALHDTVAEDFVFMEGWWEFDTHRFLMLDMMTSGSNETLVALDGVGGSCLFVRADVHRGGINFPPYVYKNQLDTESFAKAALTDGYGVYGLPNYKLLHSQPLAHLNSNE